MKQPIKNSIKRNLKVKTKKKVNKKEKNLDGSGLETFFRINILDKLGVNYEQQFEAKSIGRFYDFHLIGYNLILEVDGSFFHTDPRIYENGPVSITQKRNKRVDEIKNIWAVSNGYVLLRFWEKDIYENPEKILNYIRERIGVQKEVMLLKESKKDGSFFTKKIK